MKTYSVIEDRGDGIEYERFFGSFEECAIYLEDVAIIPDEVVYPYCNTLYEAAEPKDGRIYQYYIKRKIIY